MYFYGLKLATTRREKQLTSNTNVYYRFGSSEILYRKSSQNENLFSSQRERGKFQDVYNPTFFSVLMEIQKKKEKLFPKKISNKLFKHLMKFIEP